MKSKDEFVSRLKRVEGQVGGIIKMYEDKRGCDEMLQQLSAARSALDKAIVYLFKQESCSGMAPKQKEKIVNILERTLKIK